MTLPSSDAFVAKGNPLVHPIFGADGSCQDNFGLLVVGDKVLDAESKVNDELHCQCAAFFL